jgi:hypothetical protein
MSEEGTQRIWKHPLNPGRHGYMYALLNSFVIVLLLSTSTVCKEDKEDVKQDADQDAEQDAKAEEKDSSSEGGLSGLPEKPTRDEVMAALRKVQPAVSECCQGDGGVAMADIVVSNNGRVQSVAVTGVPEDIASCVATAVNVAVFPKFSSPKFTVSFPFRLC